MLSPQSSAVVKILTGTLGSHTLTDASLETNRTAHLQLAGGLNSWSRVACSQGRAQRKQSLRRSPLHCSGHFD